MTEQEIIDFLKKNKKTGIAFAFMPKEVQDWARENSRELCCYNQPIESTEYQWMRDGSYKQINKEGLYALSDDYPYPKQESKGEWVEFKINKIGRFTDYNVDDDDHQISFSFGWHQWSEFLECSYEHDLGYTDFGGWQYEYNSFWLTTPHVIGKEGLLTTLTNYDEDCKPVIPIKIRFWRESR